MEEVAQRTSFVLHLDTLAVLDELTDEQAGQFIKAIYLHRKGVEFSVDPLMKALLVPFIAQMKRDDEKYTKKVNANRNNGLKGGRPKANETKGNPVGFSETQHKPNESQKTREGEGEGEGENKKRGSKDKPDAAGAAIDFSPLCMTTEQVAEVKRIRKKTKGGALTQRVVNSLAVEFEAAAKIGWGPEDILSEWELRGWKSFKAEWIKPRGESFDGLSAISRKNAQNTMGEW